MVESRYATLNELETLYGLEDMWNLFEVHAVCQYNEYLAAKHAHKG